MKVFQLSIVFAILAAAAHWQWISFKSANFWIFLVVAGAIMTAFLATLLADRLRRREWHHWPRPQRSIGKKSGHQGG